jgi:hypothetical protein
LLRFDLWGQAMNNTFTSCYQQDGGYGFVWTFREKNKVDISW